MGGITARLYEYTGAASDDALILGMAWPVGLLWLGGGLVPVIVRRIVVWRRGCGAKVELPRAVAKGKVELPRAVAKGKERTVAEIHRMLVLSTGHLTQETAALLEGAQRDLPAFTRDEGWVFYVSDDLVRYVDAPAELVGVLQFARENQCRWVMFDCDGETLETLPYWEW